MAYRVSYKFEPSVYAEAIVAIAGVDELVGQATRTMGVASRAAYKAAVPSKRVGKAVSTRQRKVGIVRTVSTGVNERPMGEPIHGRDIGTTAVGRWLDKGTADGGTGLIFRRKLGPDGEPMPFMHWGYAVPHVRGQQPTGWVREARDASDTVVPLILTELDRRIDARLRRV